MKLTSIRPAQALGAVIALSALFAACTSDKDTPAPPPAALQVEVLSSRPELVTGGSALVRTSLANTSAVTATVNGTAVSVTFTPEAGSSTTAIALISGLAVGANALVLTQGASTGTLALTHCPLEGPVLSGPRQTPFICQTQDFTMLDGSKLGAATNGTTCAAPTVVQCVHLKTGTAQAAGHVGGRLQDRVS